MILNELIYAFKNDLYLEYMKRNIKKEQQINPNKKQIKLILTKVISDLQKEFDIILTSLTRTTVSGEGTVTGSREMMRIWKVFYNSTTELKLKPIKWIYNQQQQSGTPQYYGVKWIDAYPYIVMYPTPDTSGKNVLIKSYNDVTLFSINDGMDSKVSGGDTLYMKIPTMYDSAVLMGMIAEIFDDRLPKYNAEKLRLRSKKFLDIGLDYNMPGVNDEFSIEDNNYNADADDTPTALPADPVYP